jgi:hypothetical protein
MRALAPHRQAAAVPQSAVGAHLDVTLDVHRDFLAEVAFHGAFFFQNLADAVDLVLGQVANLLIEIDARPEQQRARTGTADAVDIGKPDLGPLRWRQIHTGNTCHRSSPLSLPLFVLGVDADDPHHAFAMDHLAFVANLLYRRSYFHDVFPAGPGARGENPGPYSPTSFFVILPRVGS